MTGAVRQTLTERRFDELRLSVALVAEELFVLHGGTSITVESICQSAGISQRTFYRHFAVKEDVVVPLFERAAELVIESLDAAPTDADVVPVLAEIFSRQVFDNERPAVLRRQFLRVVMDAPEYRLRWHTIDEPLTGPLADFLSRRGRVDDDPFDRSLRAGLVLHAIRLAYYHWIRTDASPDLPKLLEQALSAVVSPWAANADDQRL